MSANVKLKSLKVEILKSNPPQYIFEAGGEVPTTGWTNPRLEPRIYIDFPKDGFQDFDFVAQSPGGVVSPVKSPTVALLVIKGELPAKWEGIRVHGASSPPIEWDKDSHETEVYSR